MKRGKPETHKYAATNIMRASVDRGRYEEDLVAIPTALDYHAAMKRLDWFERGTKLVCRSIRLVL
jgi:hypothetical protein